MTTVVNKFKDKYDVYIGRTHDPLHFGNPFSFKRDSLAEVVVGSREESVEAFRKWLTGEAYKEVEPERRWWILENLVYLKGKVLGCFCSPQLCHGDILAEMADLL